MNVEILEEKIENISDNNYISILELIISSVRDYPLYGLNDTSEYFDEIKKKLNNSEISVNTLKNYLERNSKGGDENHIWIISSINSLLEAFELMDLYKISFMEILNKIEEFK